MVLRAAESKMNDETAFSAAVRHLWLAGRVIRPLIHCYTNVVAAQDTANVALLCGASPIMGDAAEEAEELTAKAYGLLLNLGMPHFEKVQAVLISLQTALKHRIPVLIDPVGVGVSNFRKQLWLKILHVLKEKHESYKMSMAGETVTESFSPTVVLRGNRREIRICYQLAKPFLLQDEDQISWSETELLEQYTQSSLDEEEENASCQSDRVSLKQQAAFLAEHLGLIVILTDEIDFVLTQDIQFANETGSSRMKDLTATGCMLDIYLLSLLTFRHAYQCSGGVLPSGFDETLFTARLLHFALQMYGRAGQDAAVLADGQKAYLGQFHSRLFDFLEKERDIFLQNSNAQKSSGYFQKMAHKLRHYAITPAYLYTQPELAFEQIEASLSHGVTCLQLRLKEGSFTEKLALAEKLRRLTKKHNVCFIINDDVQLCKACGADGVHLGLEDMSLSHARAILGEQAIIGATAHSWEEALQANAGNLVDYLGCGDVFGTKSKAAPPRLAKSELKKITQGQPLPVVAIGGIQADNIAELTGCGIVGVAVISALFQAEYSAAAVASKTNHLAREVDKWL